MFLSKFIANFYQTKYLNQSLLSVLVVYVSCFPPALAQTDKTNSNYFYFVDGQTVGNWGIVLADEDNWMLPVSTAEASSAGNRLKMGRANYQSENDAITLKWGRKKGKAGIALYGSPIDLSSLANSAALTLEIKVDRKPKGAVYLGMDCGYPCRGEIGIHKTLRKLKKGQWTTYPIPINCFAAKGLDLTKINAAFMLTTDKPFEAQIANVRLELLPAGSPTCAK